MKIRMAGAFILSSFLSSTTSFSCASAFAPVKLFSRSTTTTNPSSISPTRTFMVDSLIMDLFGGKKPGMVSPEKALPGRSTKMPNIDGLRHYVLGNLLTEVPEGYQVAVFGNGCFWGSEKSIWRLPMGIYSTAVGYCAGYTPNPTYEETCSGLTGHTEGVRVVYNPQEISVVDVVRMFWESHDPTQVNGQGNDRGTQYRSGLYFFDEDQKILYEASKVAYEKALKSAGIDRPIATQIASASDYDKYGGLWYFAESYHQQYLAKPGARPYCSAQPQSVSLPDYDEWCPFQDEQRKEFYRPKLPQSFWKQYGPKRGCSVVSESNEPISVNAY